MANVPVNFDSSRKLYFKRIKDFPDKYVPHFGLILSVWMPEWERAGRLPDPTCSFILWPSVLLQPTALDFYFAKITLVMGYKSPSAYLIKSACTWIQRRVSHLPSGATGKPVSEPQLSKLRELYGSFSWLGSPGHTASQGLSLTADLLMVVHTDSPGGWPAPTYLFSLDGRDAHCQRSTMGRQPWSQR